MLKLIKKNNNQNNKTTDRGFVAFTSVVLITAILGLIITSISIQSIDETQISQAFERSKQAQYNTQACSNYLLSELANGNNSNLVGYWKFENNADDGSGENNHGTLVSNPQYVEGKSGNALDFDGIDDYVDVGMANVHFGNTFTVSTWIYYETWNPGTFEAEYQSIFSKGSIFGGEGRELILEFRDRTGANTGGGSIALRTSLGAVGYIAYLTHPGPRWLHVIGVWSNGDQRLYLDGELVATNDHEGTPVTNSETIKIGSPSSTTSNDVRFKGKIDEVQIYNRALSPEEISALYNDGNVSGYPLSEISHNDYYIDCQGVDMYVNNENKTIIKTRAEDEFHVDLEMSVDTSGANLQVESFEMR